MATAANTQMKRKTAKKKKTTLMIGSLPPPLAAGEGRGELSKTLKFSCTYIYSILQNRLCLLKCA